MQTYKSDPYLFLSGAQLHNVQGAVFIDINSSTHPLLISSPSVTIDLIRYDT